MFYAQELFQSSELHTYSPELLQGKCYVSAIREYLRMHPVDIKDEDHFICESRYSAKMKRIERAKVFPKSKFPASSLCLCVSQMLIYAV